MPGELDGLKQVTAPKTAVVTAAQLPPEVEKGNFVDDFEVAQLPEQGSEEGTTSDKESAGGNTTTKSKAVADESPQLAERSGSERGDEDIEAGRGAEGAEVEGQGEKAEAAKDGEKKDLPKFLKPPKGKEGEAAKAAEASKATIKPIVPSSKVVRDYNGYTAEQVSAFKKMSDEGYKLATELIKQNKELQTKANTPYIQHPQAYVLDPGFQQVRTDLSFAQKEANYWEQQLVNMDAGQELVPITGFDSKTGEPILGAPIKPSKALEEKVRIMIHNCYNAAQQLNNKLQEYPTKYKETVSKDLEAIDSYRKQQFGWVNNPELLDYSIEVEGLGERTLKQVREDVTSILPQWMQTHPLATVVGDLVIALRLKQAELAERQEVQQVADVKKKEADLVEPGSKGKPSSQGRGEKVHGVSEFKVDPALGV